MQGYTISSPFEPDGSGELKMYFFTTHPFSGLSHHAHFQTKTIDKTIAFFFSNILVYNCRPNTHLPIPINEFSVTAHAQLIFETCWLLVLGVDFMFCS